MNAESYIYGDGKLYEGCHQAWGGFVQQCSDCAALWAKTWKSQSRTILNAEKTKFQQNDYEDEKNHLKF